MVHRACLRLGVSIVAAITRVAVTVTFGAVLTPGCGGGDGDPAPGKPHFEGDALDAVAQDLVDTHNDVRATATPAPAPALADLSWDDELAATAQAWANGCKFEHSQGDLGENLAFFSGTQSTGAECVQLWADEASVYDYVDNSCATGEQCGHYTQIVWRDTKRVGCGISECTIDGIDGLYWVCNYDPPGNYVGQRPY